MRGSHSGIFFISLFSHFLVCANQEMRKERNEKDTTMTSSHAHVYSTAQDLNARQLNH